MACDLMAQASEWLTQAEAALDWHHGAVAAAGAYALVAVAEFGDKSQLVCMTLATRHRHWPVLWGAVAAFALLNGLAVMFGAAVGQWLPERWVAAAVAVLFAGFGLRSLLVEHDDEAEACVERSGRGVVLTTFLMIFLAELGDKTQIAVAGLGATESPWAVWVGATAALATTSGIGIWAGKTVLRRVSARTVHVVGGLVFLSFAVLAAFRALPPDV